MNQTETCYVCGGDALPVQAPRRVKAGRRKVEITDHFMQCRACGEEYYLPGQMEESQRRASMAIASKRAALTPSQIRDIRLSLGITQAEGERLVGAGPKTWVRWERGTVVPNALTDLLLRMLRDVPGVRDYVASLNDVLLPATTVAPDQIWAPALGQWLVWNNVANSLIHISVSRDCALQSGLVSDVADPVGHEYAPAFKYPDVTTDRSRVVRAMFSELDDSTVEEAINA